MELQEAELAAARDTRLAVEPRAAIARAPQHVDPHRDEEEGEHRGEHDQENERDREVEHTLRRRIARHAAILA